MVGNIMLGDRDSARPPGEDGGARVSAVLAPARLPAASTRVASPGESTGTSNRTFEGVLGEAFVEGDDGDWRARAEVLACFWPGEPQEPPPPSLDFAGLKATIQLCFSPLCCLSSGLGVLLPAGDATKVLLTSRSAALLAHF